jgi:hypothetical protein
MTARAQNGFQWGIILTLALTSLGFAAAYGGTVNPYIEAGSRLIVRRIV